ncbi:XkdX family protein [Clostridium thermobutyricum]|uniref:XkdX family protein n=1 Tax=Clostridium thermobutyricum TaxID=29372 RepID=UPI0018AA77CF|nr:XkdX family protein [Clostridium thermobutyricum]
MEQIVLEMYQAGNWNIEQVRSLVPSVISSEQFTQITGQPYEVQTPSKPSQSSTTQTTTSQPTSPVTSQQVNQSNSTDKTSITN